MRRHPIIRGADGRDMCCKLVVKGDKIYRDHTALVWNLIHIGWPLLLMLLWLPSRAFGGGIDLEAYHRAAIRISEQIAREVPRDMPVRTLGFAPIAGDNFGFRESLQASFKQHSPYKIVERDQKDLNKIIKTQGLELGDVFDPDLRAKLGRLLGTEALVLCKIIQKQQSRFSTFLRVAIKIDNVELGEIMAVKTYSIRYIPKTTWFALGAVVISVLVLLALGLKMQKARAAKRQQQEAEQAEWLKLQTEVGQIYSAIKAEMDKVLRKLTDAYNSANAKAHSLTNPLKDLEREMLRLQQSFEFAPRPENTCHNKSDLADKIASGKILLQSVKYLLAETSAISSLTASSHDTLSPINDRLKEVSEHLIDWSK